MIFSNPDGDCCLAEVLLRRVTLCVHQRVITYGNEWRICDRRIALDQKPSSRQVWSCAEGRRTRHGKLLSICAHAQSWVEGRATLVTRSEATLTSTPGGTTPVPATTTPDGLTVQGRRQPSTAASTAVQALTSGTWSGRTASVVCSWTRLRRLRSRHRHRQRHYSRTWAAYCRDTPPASSAREDRAVRVSRTTDCAGPADAAGDASWRLHGDRRMLTSHVAEDSRRRWTGSCADDSLLTSTTEGMLTETTARNWQVSAD